MRTIFLTLFLWFLGFAAIAQPKVQWALQAGVVLNSMASSGGDFDDIRIETHTVTRFQVGLLAEMSLAKILRLRTGLHLERRGFSFEINQSVIHYEALYRPSYLQIPAIIALTNGRFHAGAGPYVAYGLGGSYHSEWSAPPNSVLLPDPQNRALKWGNNAAEHDFRRLDAGVQFEAGLTVRRFRLSAAYALGLANVQPHPDAAQVVKKNRALSLSLGTFLNRL